MGGATVGGATVGEMPVVNGPYLLAGTTPGKSLTLVKNPAYWDAGSVSIEKIEFRVVAEAARQLKLYEAGDLQVADFPASETARIEADPTFKPGTTGLVAAGCELSGAEHADRPDGRC